MLPNGCPLKVFSFVGLEEKDGISQEISLKESIFSLT